MGSCGSCMFKTGYTLYANTFVGRVFHNKMLKRFKKQYGDHALHTRLTPFVFNELMIMPLPFLINNYAYMVADIKANNFVLVDIGDASRMKDYPLPPDAILTTHRHWDHCGGNREMRAAYAGLDVYGGAVERVPDSTYHVDDGEVVKFGRLKFKAMWTPGHTRGHIVWVLSGEPFGVPDSAFTGDLLMLAGCGAPFEGPPHMLVDSLDRVAKLPPETLVWPGHEMAVEGLELAVHIEPDNLAGVLKLLWVIARREKALCTCPSTIQEECSYNPFMRTKNETFLEALGMYQCLDMERTTKDEQKEFVDTVFEQILYKHDELRGIKIQKRKQKALEEKMQSQLTDVAPTGDRSISETMIRDLDSLQKSIMPSTGKATPQADSAPTGSRSLTIL